MRVSSLNPRSGRSSGRLLSPLTWCLLISFLTQNGHILIKALSGLYQLYHV